MDVRRLRLVADTARVDVPTDSARGAALLGEVDDPVGPPVAPTHLAEEGSFPDDAA